MKNNGLCMYINEEKNDTKISFWEKSVFLSSKTAAKCSFSLKKNFTVSAYNVSNALD